MDAASHHHSLDAALIAKIEQCRRLAAEINDRTTSRRLLELADEYVQHLKCKSEGSRQI
jgi:hypothetical protein